MNNKINLQIEKLNAIGNGSEEAMINLSQGALERQRFGIEFSQQHADYNYNFGWFSIKSHVMEF